MAGFSDLNASFAQYLPKAKGAAPVAAPPPSGGAFSDLNASFAAFKPQAAPSPEEQSSALGTIARVGGRQVLPAAGGMAGFGAGAELGGLAGAPLGPVGAGVGALGGGLVGAFGGATGVNFLQDKILSALPPGLRKLLGQDEEQMAADQAAHPYVSMGAEIAPQLLFMRPGAVAKVAEDAPAIAKLLAHPVASRGVGAGLGAVQALATEVASGGDPDLTQIGLNALIGAMLNRETRLGKATAGAGAKLIPGAKGRAGSTAPGGVGGTGDGTTPPAQPIQPAPATTVAPPAVNPQDASLPVKSDNLIHTPPAPDFVPLPDSETGQPAAWFNPKTGEVKALDPTPASVKLPVEGGQNLTVSPGENASVQRETPVSAPPQEPVQPVSIAAPGAEGPVLPAVPSGVPEAVAQGRQPASQEAPQAVPAPGALGGDPGAGPAAIEPAQPVAPPIAPQALEPAQGDAAPAGRLGLAQAAAAATEALKTETDPAIRTQLIRIANGEAGEIKPFRGGDANSTATAHEQDVAATFVAAARGAKDGEKPEPGANQAPASTEHPAGMGTTATGAETTTPKPDVGSDHIADAGKMVTADQARAALKTGIDPTTGKRPVGNKALRDMRATMKLIVQNEKGPLVQKPKGSRQNVGTDQTFLKTVHAMGGIRTKNARGDLTPEGSTIEAIAKDHRMPGLINNKSGRYPDDLHSTLQQSRWFNGEMDPSDIKHFNEYLDRSVRGEKIYHPESEVYRQAAVAKAQEGETQARDDIRRHAEEAGQAPLTDAHVEAIREDMTANGKNAYDALHDHIEREAVRDENNRDTEGDANADDTRRAGETDLPFGDEIGGQESAGGRAGENRTAASQPESDSGTPGAKEPAGVKKPFAEFIAEQRAAHKANADRVTTLFERDKRVIGVAKDNPKRRIVLTKGTDAAPYRVTSFDGDEPTGHRDYGAITGKDNHLDNAADEFGNHYQITEPTPKAAAPTPKAEAPAPEPQAEAPKSAEPLTFESFAQLEAKMRHGDMTATEAMAAFERVIASEKELKAELLSYPKDRLAKMNPRDRNETKPRIVDSLYSSFLNSFNASGTYSWSPFGKEGPTAGIRKAMEKQTDQHIKEAAEKRKARSAEIVQTYTNPQTLDQFDSFVRARGRDKLTDEQKIKYDELAAAAGRETQAREKARDNVVKKAETEGATASEIIETKHTQKGHALFVVKMSARVGNEAFRGMLSNAKRIGGTYSSYAKDGAVPGFQFKTREAAELFKQSLEGDVSKGEIAAKRADEVQDNAVARLRDMAARMTEESEESLGRDRLANTARRARMAAGAEAQAAANKALATTMKNIADAIENEEVRNLGGIRTRADVETLDVLLRRARHEWVIATRDADPSQRYEKLMETPINAEMVEKAKFPYPYAHRETAEKLARGVAGKPGVKRMAAALIKTAQAAQRRGDWRVVGDQLGSQEELREVAQAALKDPNLKYEAESVLETFKDYERIKRMGLREPAAMRAALREFLDYRGKTTKADPLKAAERAMIGTKIPGYFPTPKELSTRVAEEADIRPGMKVLEPEAGKGNIADAIKSVAPDADLSVIEPNTSLRNILEMKGHKIIGSDFLEENGQYDRIVMNPPFEDRADVEHVQHAYDLLKPGGRVVSIMSEGPFFGSDKRAVAFRDWLEEVGGTSEKLPDKSFADAERPTGVATRMVVIDKPAERGAMFARRDEEDMLDMGPDGILPQKVIPGAERLTGEELQKRDLARRMEGKKKATAGQKAVTGLGMFGGEMEATREVKKKDQGSLFARRDDEKPDAKGASASLKEEFPKVDFYLGSHANGDWKLYDLIVPKGDRGHGVGTAFMDRLTHLADRAGTRLILSPAIRDDNMGTTSRGRLVRFYKRNGFVENKGRNKDFRISEGMYRDPKRSALFARRDEKTFYSALGRSVDAVKQARAPAGQWKAIIKNAQGVKREEIEWSGIEQWLDDQKGPVTKEAVQEFLRENNVDIRDVTLGGPTRDETPPDQQAQDEHGPEFERLNQIIREAREEQRKHIGMADKAADQSYRVAKNKAERFEQQRDDLHSRMVDETIARGGASKGPTRYGTYQLPGGENYRELLLTLPQKRPPHVERINAINERLNDIASYSSAFHERNPQLVDEHDALRRERDQLVEKHFGVHAPMDELPEGYEVIHDQTAPQGSQWGVIPPGQTHARPMGGTTYSTAARAKEAALERLNYNNAVRMREKLNEALNDNGYMGTHFSDAAANVLAHVRFNDRTDADGKKVLFIEEVQSDWHQKGRREGYLTPDRPKALAKAKADLNEMRPAVHEMVERNDRLGFDTASEARNAIGHEPESFEYDTPEDKALALKWSEAWKRRQENGISNASAVPDAPFKQSWHELAMKRMLRYAAEKGYDRVAWTTGDTQNARYDLSKQIDRVEYMPKGDSGRLVGVKGNRIVLNEANVPKAKLPDYIGKDVAEKLLATEIVPLNPNANQPQHGHMLQGVDLKVGGEGMKGFYDKILPSFLNKYTKKWGAKVGGTGVHDQRLGPLQYEGPTLTPEEFLRKARTLRESAIGAGVLDQLNRVTYDVRDRGIYFEQAMNASASPTLAKLFGGDMVPSDQSPIPVHSIDVTPAMRESVMEGQPMFAKGEDGPKTPRSFEEIGENIYGAFSEELKPQREALAAELRQRLDAMGLHDVGVRIADAIYGRGEDGKVYAGDGFQLKKLITVALEAKGHEFVLDHEAIHAMRALDLFTEKEWAVLTDEATKTWHDHFRIGERYADYAPEMQTEEAVAHAFQKWRQNQLASRPAIRRILHAMSNALRAIASAFRGRGFKTVDSIFNQAASGRIGRRGLPAGEGRTEPSFARMNEKDARDLAAEKERDTGKGWWASKRTDENGEEYWVAATHGIKATDAGPPAEPDPFRTEKSGQTAMFARRAGVVGTDLGAPDPTSVDYLTDSSLSFAERLKGAVSAHALSAGLDRFRVNFQDRFLPLLRTQQRMETLLGRPLTEQESAYLKQSLQAGRSGSKFEDLTTKASNLIHGLAEAKISREELEAYLYAKFAPKRNENIDKINPAFRGDMLKPGDPGSGMSDADATAILAAVDASGKRAQFDALGDQVYQILADSVKERVDSGLMSQAEADAWKANNGPHYVPLRGRAEIDPDSDVSRPRTGGAFNIRGKESQQAFGRKTPARDILAYSLMQAQEAIARAETNRVAQAFHDMAKLAPDPEFWSVDKIERRPVWNKAKQQVEYQSVRELLAKDKDYTVSTKINGVEHRVTMNQNNPVAARLAQAMKGLPDHQVSAIVRTFGQLNRMLSHVNTTLNPEFVITNAMRDAFEAMANLRQYDAAGLIKTTLKHYPSALKASWKSAFGKEDTSAMGVYAKEFRADGGRVYFNQLEDIADIRSRMARELRNAESGPSVLKAIRSIGRTIENVNLGVENGIRLSAYRAAREAGMSRDAAAALAKNLTVNFNRRGQYGPLLNSLYLFYNASVQGTATLMTAAAKSAKVRQVLGAAIALGATLEITNSMTSGNDKDGESFYDKRITAYDKSHNLVIMDPGGSGHALKIPLPYGYSAFFAMGRAMAEIYRGKPAAAAAGNLATAILDAFNPIGGSESLLRLISPTISDPVVDLAQNRDFTGKPIMPDQPQYGAKVPESQRYWGSVSPIAKAVTDFLGSETGGDQVKPGAIDVSPEVLDYLFGQVTGAAGAFYERNANLGAKLLDPNSEITWNDIPFARRAVTGDAPWVDRGLFYQRSDEITQAMSYVKNYAKRGEGPEARGEIAENKALLSLGPLATKTRDALAELRQARGAMELARDAGKITKDVYSARVKKLKDAEDKLITQFNTQYVKRGLVGVKTIGGGTGAVTKPAGDGAVPNVQGGGRQSNNDGDANNNSADSDAVHSGLPQKGPRSNTALADAVKSGDKDALQRLADSGVTWTREDVVNAATKAGMPATAALLQSMSA